MLARRQRSSAFPVTFIYDRIRGTLRDGRISVRAASRARGIGCVACGTQGCVVRVILVCHFVCLCMVCAQNLLEAFCVGSLRLRLRSSVETNGRDTSVYPAVARYLAVAQNNVQA